MEVGSPDGEAEGPFDGTIVGSGVGSGVGKAVCKQNPLIAPASILSPEYSDQMKHIPSQ